MNWISEIEYLQLHMELAASHVFLQHSSERKAFFGDDEREFSAETSAANDFVMLMEPPNGGFEGDADMARDVVRGGFHIMGRLRQKTGVKYRDNEAVSDQAKQIGVQCIMRIMEMANDAANCNFSIAPFKASEVKYQKVWFAEGWVGYKFTYPLRKADVIDEQEGIWL